MRLVVGLFAMFLTASIARADEAKAPEAKLETSRVKVPLRLVKVLADSRQVLLFDKNKGTHVLAEVGQTIDGYTVDDIDEEEVTLITTSGKEIVLTLPAPAVEAPAKKATRAPAKAVLVPADPYAAPATEAPVDPYAEPAVRSAAAPSALPAILPALGAEGPIVDPAAAPADPSAAAAAAANRSAATFVPPVREMGSDPNSTDAAPADPYAAKAAPSFAPPAPADAAPADPYATAPKKAAKPVKGAAAAGAFLPPGTSAADAAAPAPAAKPVVAPPAIDVDDPYAADDEPAPAPKARPVVVAPPAPALDPDAPPAPVITPTVLSRSELNVALGDFNKLSSMLRGSFTKDGARLDSVAPNSVFAKAGLRAGDVVTAVDNAPIRSIDDAAELYVRAPQTRAANIQLLRGGKPMTLRVLMQ